MYEVSVVEFEVENGGDPIVLAPGWKPFAAGLNEGVLRVAIRRRVPLWARVLRKLRSRVPAAAADEVAARDS